MKNITICADDFALSPTSSRYIIELVTQQRLSATSVMTQSPHWATFAPELASIACRLDVGLHFNLTHPFDSNARPLSHWLLLSQMRRLPKTWLRDRLLEQIDLFTEHFQRLPDFIDGHQHVHAFPVVRDALLEAIGLRWTNTSRPYLRAPDCLRHAGGAWIKAGVLKAACVRFSSDARSQGYAFPDWFGGLYALKPDAGFPDLMRQWLNCSSHHGLIMCHPGANELGDPIGPSRASEYHYLSSQEFHEHCLENHVVIGRFSSSFTGN